MKHFSDAHTERACLATAITRNEALLDIVTLTDEAFYNNNNKIIYKTLKNLHKEGEKIDIITLRNALLESGNLEKIGGQNYLVELLQEQTIVNFKYAIRTLAKLSLRRKLFTLSEKINDLTKTNVENELILNEIENTIRSIDSINKEEFIEAEKLFDSGIEQYDITGKFLPTGFEALDSRLIGLFKSELIILAARPGCGKTALALNIATGISKNKNVLFISLEMSPSQLGLRMLSSEAMVDSDFIRRGIVNESDKAKLNNSRERLKNINMTFVESYTLDEIIAKIRKVSQYKLIELVVIDYLQLIQVTSQNQRYIQVGEISRRLKLLSRELDIPILCLAQLNRSADDRVPKLSDLRESGDIEQDADVVLFIHKQPEEKGNIVNIIFAKNRSGKADARAEMIFRKEFTRFFDVDNNHSYEEL